MYSDDVVTIQNIQHVQSVNHSPITIWRLALFYTIFVNKWLYRVESRMYLGDVLIAEKILHAQSMNHLPFTMWKLVKFSHGFCE
jgi:hypothetical protein